MKKKKKKNVSRVGAPDTPIVTHNSCTVPTLPSSNISISLSPLDQGMKQIGIGMRRM